MSHDSIETRTQEIGREIFARVGTDSPSVASPQWWDELLMELTMRDEAIKVQLFRFVDALPALGTPGQIAAHVREYFEQIKGRLPRIVRAAINLLPYNGQGSLIASLVAKAARFNANRLARRFIAGTTLQETLAAIREMRRQSLAFTVDLLGEAVLSRAEALRYQRMYLEFVEGLAADAARWPQVPLIDRDHQGAIARVNVSVKLSSLYSQFDPIDPEGTSGAVKDRLRPILRLARRRGVFVNIDMEQFAYKDQTLAIFMEVLEEEEFRDWGDVGIAIQAYLRSCGDDLQRLASWAAKRGTAVWVRLVKGAYWDYETIIAAQNGWPTPVFWRKRETDANFERQTEFLIEHREWLRPAIASHNIRSIAHALALIEEHNVPRRLVEFQMLFGMADPIKSALVSMGQRVRVYTPFGQLLPGMAYLVRRLLENTSNQSFLRAGFLEHLPVEELLMNPATLDRGTDEQPVSGAASNAAGTSGFRNEPPTHFSIAENRASFAAALRDVRASLGKTYPLIVNNVSVDTPRTIDSEDPSDPSRVVGHCGSATPEDAQRAIAAARGVFDSWRDRPARERADLLFRTAAVLRRRRFELAAWEVFECGKPWRESDADVAEAIDFCEYYAREMLRLASPLRRDVPGEENEYFYEGRGVCIVIAPWNFPLAILCGMTSAALVAGNTVIMKPAEQSSVVAAKLMEAFIEAGAPPGVVNYLPGIGEEMGPTLVNDPDVDLIAFTGSRSVGLWINEKASVTPAGQDHVKRIITEMGGKNAIIVDDDADLDEAVHGVAASAFGYAGQKCSACSRVIVLEGIYDAFVARLVEVTRSLKVGAAEDASTFIGPVIDAEAHQRILQTIDRAKHKHRLVYPDASTAEGSAVKGEGHGQDARGTGGYFITPHVFADVDPASALAQEEIFGPVLAAMKARDLGEAIRIANSTQYALTGGVYSRSPRNIARARREFRVGNLYINRKITGALVDRQPFGGFKLSGIGSKAGGPDYLLQFLIPRAITENTLRHGFAPASEPLHTDVPGE